MKIAVWTALTVLAAAAIANAQYTTGRLVGTVIDPSGASVPQARITATEQETNTSSETVSGSAGEFTFESLRPGTYTISAAASGFRTLQVRDSLVTAQHTSSIQLTLQIGAVSENVRVESTATQVDTATATVQNTFSPATLLSLPVLGRDPRTAVELTAPGVTQVSSGSGFSYNGAPSTSNNYRIDGTSLIDYNRGGSAPFPAVENLQEFNVVTNASGAAYGTGAGGQVSAVIKSGTNDLHGIGWAYLSDPAWNANSWEGNANGQPKTGTKQNWFGGNIGGPVYLPHLYHGRNKTFFFVSFEYTNPQQKILQLERVPTAAERGGDFRGSSWGVPVINGVPTPIVPTSMFSGLAKGLLANTSLLPLPTGPDGSYSWVSTTSDEVKTTILKMDHNFTDRHRIWGSLNWQNNVATTDSAWAYIWKAQQLPNPGYNYGQENNTHTFSFNDTYTFSPTAVNVFNFGYSNLNNPITRTPPSNAPTWSSLGAPNVQIENGGSLTQVMVAVNPWNPNGFVVWGGHSGITQETDYSYSESFTLIKGRHTIKLGYEDREHTHLNSSNWEAAGRLTFSTANAGSTGNPYADFLTGLGGSWEQYSHQDANLVYPSREPYAEDQIKVNRKLTVTAGLRWAPHFGIRDVNNKLSAFRPDQQSTQFPLAPKGLVVPGDRGFPGADHPNIYTNFAPRIAVAYDPTGTGRMAIRAGYGIYYDFQYLITFNAESTSPPWGLTYAPPSASFDVSNPYNGQQLFPYNPPVPGSSSASGFVFPSTPLVIQNNFAPNFNVSRVHQYNATYQFEPFRTYLFTVGYVGTRGTHLPFTRNQNLPLFIPNASTNANQQQRRPYPQFNDISTTYGDANSRYDSLQITLNKRLSHGVTLIGNYVYNRNLQQLGERNPYDFSIDYGRSGTPQSAALTYSWDLPFFASSRRLLRTTLGGWTWGGTMRVRAGDYLTVSSSGGFNRLSAGGTANANYIGGSVYGSHDSQASKAAGWLNLAAFCPANTNGSQCTPDPTVGVTHLVFGNTPPGFVQGPSAFQNDMTLSKRFLISERWGAAEFRAAAFNLFNHTLLGDPSADIGNIGIFGKITRSLGPRNLQLSVRYSF
jgi:hypothetical protein